ncbi:MAG: hypothetical protein HY917_01615 [Candidatus Diapherotrites archaeon]|nr:hypothetical protein [Candidatus Diapherotrites archaeon]
MLEWLGLFLVSGFLMIKCADALVENSSKLAGSVGLSDFFIGSNSIAFGTSLPELVTTIISSVQGAPPWEPETSSEATSPTSCSFSGSWHSLRPFPPATRKKKRTFRPCC